MIATTIFVLMVVTRPPSKPREEHTGPKYESYSECDEIASKIREHSRFVNFELTAYCDERVINEKENNNKH